MNYYGDKISDNMAVTPEGFLICANVPIGRTGWMSYLAQELPAAFNEPFGTVVQVYRSPEELFKADTIASFEGKSVTNTHPVKNLDVNTAPMIERGHLQNVRREGDLLVADLFIKDAGLMSEVQNDIKREVSSGYDCSWHKIGEGKFEQRDIVGNHVAVVPAGRAGPKIAIMDAQPIVDPMVSMDPVKPKTGGKKTMTISKKILTAMGFKAFVQDAEPEDIAKAMDAMKEDEPTKEPAKDAEPAKEPPKEEVKDAGEVIPAWAQALIDDVKALKSSSPKDAKPDDAKDVMDAIESDLDKDVKDEDPGPEKKEPAKDAEPDPEKKPAADAALRKFVADMKPIIMAIPDEKTRLEAAKQFKASVQDARSSRATNGYSNILGTVDANKKAAMDALSTQRKPVAEQSEEACKAWSVAGEKMRGGK